MPFVGRERKKEVLVGEGREDWEGVYTHAHIRIERESERVRESELIGTNSNLRRSVLSSKD